MHFHLTLVLTSKLWLKSIGASVTLLLAALCLTHPGQAENLTNADILILHSYHYGYKWTDDIAKGLDQTLSRSRVPLSLHVEYMDTKRVVTPNYDKDLAAFYQKNIRALRLS